MGLAFQSSQPGRESWNTNDWGTGRSVEKGLIRCEIVVRSWGSEHFTEQAAIELDFVESAQ